MDALTILGAASVSAMQLCYAFESRSAWFVLAFTLACHRHARHTGVGQQNE